MQPCATTRRALLAGVAWSLGAALCVGRASPLPDLLGPDLREARVAALRDDALVRLDLATGRVRVLQTRKGPGSDPGAFSRPHWSPDGTEILCASGDRAFIYAEDGSRRRILESQPKVFEPNWWEHPETGVLHVVFKTDHSKNSLARGQRGETRLANLETGEVRTLFDIPTDAGLSRDGTHLGETYAHAAIIDLLSDTVTRIHPGQACNGSMSPDNSYRLMYLYLPHTRFGIRDKYGHELWTIENPRGSKEWQGPRWSNHPDFAMATAQYGEDYKPVLVRLADRRIAELRDLSGSWRVPHLWLPASRDAATAFDLLEGLPLKRLGAWRARLATPGDLTPHLNELRRIDDSEADAMLGRVEAWARAELDRARAETNPAVTAAVHRRLKDRLTGHPAGIEAARVLDSPAFHRDLEAAPAYADLERWAAVIRYPPGVPARFDEPRFLEPNRPALVALVEACRRTRAEHPGTAAAQLAEKLTAQFGLPERTGEEDRQRLRVRGEVVGTSTVRRPVDILPYREALTYIRYRVVEVQEGAVPGRELVAVHWMVREGQPALGSILRPGDQVDLALESFLAHPDLGELMASNEAEDLDQPAWWAVDAQVRKPR